MDRITNVLVATDLSPASDAAITHGARLAKRAGASLSVVHVASSETLEVLGSIMPETKDASDAYLKEQASMELEARFKKLGLESPPKYEVRLGKPHKEIAAAAEETGADLLVIGATGLTGRRMGTVSGRVVRMSPVSVLMVPEQHAGEFSSVLACIDFSEDAPEVMRQASIMAGLEDATLHAVYVYHMTEASSFVSDPDSVMKSIAEFPNLMASRFTSEVEPAADGRAVTLSLVESADYTKGILRHVTSHTIDLVAVGTTKRTKLGYALMGTTAEKVIRDSDGAVLAVR